MGGTGSGKTWLAPRWLYSKLMAHPGSRALCIGLGYDKHVDRVMVRLTIDFLAELNVKFDHNKKTGIITFSNGSQMLFGSADNPLSLEGAHLDYCWIDEGGMMSLTTFEVAQRRTALAWGEGKGQILITTIPYFEGWLKLQVYEPFLAGDPTIDWIACFDQATEVLTDQGWIPWKEATTQHRFATRSPSGEFQWQAPDRIIAQPYSGEMVHLTSKSVDLLVTPDHRVLMAPYGTHGPLYKGDEERFVEARSLREKVGLYKAPATAEWVGAPIAVKRFSRSNRWNSVGPDKISFTGQEYAFFMGAFLSEGWASAQPGYRIDISQRTYSKGFPEFKELLEAKGFQYRSSRHCWVLNCKVLAEHLVQFGSHSYNKLIPKEIMEATKPELEKFWHAFFLGDGSKQAGGHVTLWTTSEVMAGQLQEIALKLGKWARITASKDDDRLRTIAGGAPTVRNHPLYAISVCSAKTQGFRAKREQYNGMVYCASVPNGTLYVRRNGQPMWSGNCKSSDNPKYPRDEIERMRKNNPTRFQIFYLGEWAKMEGLIFPNPDNEQLITDSFLIPPSWPAYAAHDYGYNAPTTGVWARHDPINDIVYIVADYEARKLTIEDHLYEWDALGLTFVDEAWGDPANPEVWERIAQLGYPIQPGVNRMSYGIDCVNDRLLTGRLKIFRGCKKLLDHRATYRWDKAIDESIDGPYTDKPKKPQAAEHLMDALRYLCVGLAESGRGAPPDPVITARWRGVGGGVGIA